MKHFLIKIFVMDPYPKENIYRSDASNLSAAIGKAIRQWRVEFKGRKIKQLTIKIEVL